MSAACECAIAESVELTCSDPRPCAARNAFKSIALAAVAAPAAGTASISKRRRMALVIATSPTRDSGAGVARPQPMTTNLSVLRARFDRRAPPNSQFLKLRFPRRRLCGVALQPEFARYEIVP